MLSRPVFMLLLSVIYVRPQEYFTFLTAIPLLQMVFGLSLLGYIVDTQLNLVRFKSSPHSRWMIAFTAWCIVTVILKAPTTIADAGLQIVLTFLVGYLAANGFQTFRSLNQLSLLSGAIMIFLLVGSFYQDHQPFACLRITAADPTSGIFDDRSCWNAGDCEPLEPGAEYRCEKQGIMGTNSISGRIRYRGILQDPNDLALAVSLIMPLLISLVRQRPTKGRIFLILLLIGIAFWGIMPTQSRGGQLSFMVMLGMHFLFLFGWKKSMVAGLPLIPVLLYMVLRQNPDRADAEASSEERIRCQWNALRMFRFFPATGVGWGQITEHWKQTSHNAYLLAPAELGIPGTYLWYSLFYLSFKILLSGRKRVLNKPEAKVAKIWAEALLVTHVTMHLGISFLSWCYHYLYWFYTGLVGAFYKSLKTHDPEWEVRMESKDYGKLAAVAVGILLFWNTFINFKHSRL